PGRKLTALDSSFADTCLICTGTRQSFIDQPVTVIIFTVTQGLCLLEILDVTAPLSRCTLTFGAETDALLVGAVQYWQVVVDTAVAIVIFS
ncbi:MAG TPA: hypothetical protein DCE42_04260, partial [Myxococcales bacterium]|nr:hypothetical protein [Myxococcales bacterium]